MAELEPVRAFVASAGELSGFRCFLDNFSECDVKSTAKKSQN